MRFIKLTLRERGNWDKYHRDYSAITERELMINAASIEAVTGGEGKDTYVHTTAQSSFFVKESISEVLALVG